MHDWRRRYEFYPAKIQIPNSERKRCGEGWRRTQIRFEISASPPESLTIAAAAIETGKTLNSKIYIHILSGRVDLDGNPIKPMTTCMIGAGGFIGSHLCQKLLTKAVDVCNDKIKHFLEPFSERIQFHRLKHQE
ncbi:hypothetical protein ACS0TY_005725 [Phlomoides rotata]